MLELLRFSSHTLIVQAISVASTPAIESPFWRVIGTPAIGIPVLLSRAIGIWNMALATRCLRSSKLPSSTTTHEPESSGGKLKCARWTSRCFQSLSERYPGATTVSHTRMNKLGAMIAFAVCPRTALRNQMLASAVLDSTWTRWLTDHCSETWARRSRSLQGLRPASFGSEEER